MRGVCSMADGGARTDPGADHSGEDRMFVLVFAVPALIVVVIGYVVGYALAAWVCGLLGADATRTPEVVGWTTGQVLLAGVLWLLGTRRGRRNGGAHQK